MTRAERKVEEKRVTEGTDRSVWGWVFLLLVLQVSSSLQLQRKPPRNTQMSSNVSISQHISRRLSTVRGACEHSST